MPDADQDVPAGVAGGAGAHPAAHAQDQLALASRRTAARWPRRAAPRGARTPSSRCPRPRTGTTTSCRPAARQYMASTMRWRWSPLVSDLGRGTSNRRTTNAATAVRRSRTADSGPQWATSSASSRPGTGVGAPSSMRTSAASSASTSPRPGQERQLEARGPPDRGAGPGPAPDGVAAVMGGRGATACALRHRVRPAEVSARVRGRMPWRRRRGARTPRSARSPARARGRRRGRPGRTGTR